MFRDSSELILSDVSHELGLQSLCAKLAADMQRAFAESDLFIPCAQIQDRLIEIDS